MQRKAVKRSTSPVPASPAGALEPVLAHSLPVSTNHPRVPSEPRANPDDLFPTKPPVLPPGPSAALKKAVIDFQWKVFQLKVTDREEHSEMIEATAFAGVMAVDGAHLLDQLPVWLAYFNESGDPSYLFTMAFELAVFAAIGVFILKHAKRAFSYHADNRDRKRECAALTAIISGEMDDAELRKEIRTAARTTLGFSLVSAKLRKYRFLR